METAITGRRRVHVTVLLLEEAMAGEKRLNRTGQAYELLASEILRGRWQPGDTLSTYALSEELKISRTPISEALKRLEAEGLVEIIPQVGCRVVCPDSQTIAELFALRGPLEGLAAESAAVLMPGEQIEKLEAVVVETERAAAAQDTHTFNELNYEFHLKIIEASGMPRLIQILHGVWSQLRYQLVRRPFTEEQMGEALVESALQHREIFEALKRGAADEARLLCERHVRGCRRWFAAGSICEVPPGQHTGIADWQSKLHQSGQPNVGPEGNRTA